jgi:hypothetical protein
MSSNVDAYLTSEWLVVHIVTERSEVRISEGTRNFSLLRIVQTGYGAHPASEFVQMSLNNIRIFDFVAFLFYILPLFLTHFNIVGGSIMFLKQAGH